MGERVRWTEGFIAVDWGTTNRRAYLLDGSGSCTDEFEDGRGILSVAAGDFPTAVAEVRSRLGDKSLLLGGMVGSNRGWIEAPYVACPAGLEEISGALVWAGDREAIIPGVSYLGEGRADVMRGEEVQLLGAVASGLVPRDCLVCHPGTHNKWVLLSGGKIISFRTVMTGEIFSLLKEHSILADLLQRDVAPQPAFFAGAGHGLVRDDIASELFAIRARVLLGQSPKDDAAAFTSGLLIGADVRIGLGDGDWSEVIVMGRPELTSLYAVVLREAGVDCVEMDGEQCFLAGAKAIAKMMT